jgi:hypothetical protein
LKPELKKQIIEAVRNREQVGDPISVSGKEIDDLVMSRHLNRIIQVAPDTGRRRMVLTIGPAGGRTALAAEGGK